jgi:hypothetical protein
VLKKSPGLGDLALVAQEEPTAGEDLLQLLLVYLRVGEVLPAHQPTFDIDQLVFLDNHIHLRKSQLLTTLSILI